MKIRLCMDGERQKEVAAFLAAHGIEVDEESALVLSEEGRYADRLPVRRVADGERVYLSCAEMVYLESYGHSVYVHATSGEFVTAEPLYQIERKINPAVFVRVSASVLVAHPKIREIKPSLARKYVLLLEGGAVVDVTRSYYTLFREKFNL